MADKRFPYYNYELQFIKEYVEKKFGERITLQKLKTELSNHSLLITPLSTTTISKILKENSTIVLRKALVFEFAATLKYQS